MTDTASLDDDLYRMFQASLQLRIRVRRAAQDPALFDRLALLKAQCLDPNSVYNQVVADRGYDPLDRSALRLDREGQKR